MQNIHIIIDIPIGPRRNCPSRGTPNHLMASYNRTARIDPQLIPSQADAVRQYEEAGGRITHFSGFGKDPLVNNTTLIQQREAEFHQRYPNFHSFFHKLVNGDDSVFRNGLVLFIQLTQTLHRLM